MQIGPYTVLEEIARGGHGVVYRARGAAGRLVALKLMLAHRAQNEKARKRFEVEAKALARLRHPNVVATLGAGEHDGYPWLALEYVEGESLEARLGRGPLPIEEAVGVTRQLALALSYVHVCGLLHRDLKPDNVLLRGERALLTDFGLALDLEASISRLTAAGMFLGTPGFWPPEQAQGELENLGPTADVYGLGAVLYACLTGRPPVEARSLQEYLQTFQFSGVTAPRVVRAEVPQWLSDLCMRCLSVAPAARPRSMEELVALLERRRALEAPLAATTSPEPPEAASASAPAPLLEPRAESSWPRDAQPHFRPALIGVVSAIPMALLVAWILLGRAEPEPAPAVATKDTTPPTLLILAPKGNERLELPATVTVRGVSRDLGGTVRIVVGERSTLTDDKDAFSLAVEVQEPLLTVTAIDEAGNATEKTVSLRSEWARPAPVPEPDEPRPSPAPTQEVEALVASGFAKLQQGRCVEAIEDYDLALQLDPRNATAYGNRGIAKTRLGRHAEAMEDCDRVLQLDPRSAAAYVNRGFAKANLGRHAEAIEDYDRALQLDPEHVLAHVNRGLAKANLGRRAEAIEDYDRALQLDPEHVLGHVNRGLAKANLGRYAEAIEDYDRALQLDPEHVLAHVNRGLAKANLGRHAEAIEDYDRALQLDPRSAAAYVNRGFAKAKLGWLAEAIEDYDRALQLDPRSAAAYANRGVAKAKLGWLAEAIEDYDRALQLDPNYANAYANRGAAKAKLGWLAEAIEDYDRALQFEPQFAAGYASRGVAKVRLGRFAEAIEDFDRALGLGGGADEAQTRKLRAQAEAKLGGD